MPNNELGFYLQESIQVFIKYILLTEHDKTRSNSVSKYTTLTVKHIHKLQILSIEICALQKRASKPDSTPFKKEKEVFDYKQFLS